MKVWLKPSTIAISCLVAIAAVASGFTGVSSNSAKAQQKEHYSCETVFGIPTTIVKTPQGEKKFIAWDSKYFELSGYPPERRCREVTARLNAYFRENSEQLITHGKMNNQPIVCIAKYEGGGCDSLLYTLKPDRDGETAVNLLVSMTESNFSNTVLREGPCQTYLNLQSVVNGKPKAKKVCSK